jgi:hypothetical protein
METREEMSDSIPSIDYTFVTTAGPPDRFVHGHIVASSRSQDFHAASLLEAGGDGRGRG